MKLIIFSALLVCIISSASASLQPHRPDRGFLREFPPRSTSPTFPRPPNYNMRVRRQSNGVSIEGRQPLSGPDRRPSIDINYNHRVYDNNRGRVDAYGGANLYAGHITPHAGIKAERQYNNGFLGAFGQVQPGPRGNVDPSFGIRGGFRF